jgi:hypothetical protein
MAAGESHAWSWLKRGCVVRSCPVVFLYVLRAFSKMTLKLDDDAVAGGLSVIEVLRECSDGNLAYERFGRRW